MTGNTTGNNAKQDNKQDTPPIYEVILIAHATRQRQVDNQSEPTDWQDGIHLLAAPMSLVGQNREHKSYAASSEKDAQAEGGTQAGSSKRFVPASPPTSLPSEMHKGNSPTIQHLEWIPDLHWPVTEPSASEESTDTETGYVILHLSLPPSWALGTTETSEENTPTSKENPPIEEQEYKLDEFLKSYKTKKILEAFGITNPSDVTNMYPHKAKVQTPNATQIVYSKPYVLSYLGIPKDRLGKGKIGRFQPDSFDAPWTAERWLTRKLTEYDGGLYMPALAETEAAEEGYFSPQPGRHVRVRPNAAAFLALNARQKDWFYKYFHTAYLNAVLIGVMQRDMLVRITSRNMHYADTEQKTLTDQNAEQADQNADATREDATEMHDLRDFQRHVEKQARRILAFRSQMWFQIVSSRPDINRVLSEFQKANRLEEWNDEVMRDHELWEQMVTTQITERDKKMQDFIAVIAAVFALPSLVLALGGVNGWELGIWPILILSILVGITTVLYLKKRQNRLFRWSSAPRQRRPRPSRARKK